MIICKYCDHKNDDYNEFCSNCGAEIIDDYVVNLEKEEINAVDLKKSNINKVSDDRRDNAPSENIPQPTVDRPRASNGPYAPLRYVPSGLCPIRELLFTLILSASFFSVLHVLFVMATFAITSTILHFLLFLTWGFVSAGSLHFITSIPIRSKIKLGGLVILGTLIAYYILWACFVSKTIDDALFSYIFNFRDVINFTVNKNMLLKNDGIILWFMQFILFYCIYDNLKEDLAPFAEDVQKWYKEIDLIKNTVALPNDKSVVTKIINEIKLGNLHFFINGEQIDVFSKKNKLQVLIYEAQGSAHVYIKVLRYIYTNKKKTDNKTKEKINTITEGLVPYSYFRPLLEYFRF
jgi:hypothetical protein